MKKIVILGCENSHAERFLALLKEDPAFADITCIGVYSDELPEAEKLRDAYGVPILPDYGAAVGLVEGVIVTARHGDNHYKYALPYIESGVPMFIDKPITANAEEALVFMRALRRAGVRVTGGSSLRSAPEVRAIAEAHRKEKDGRTVGAAFRAPLDPDARYGGFWFYAQHLIQIMQETFGYYPESVRAFTRNGAVNCIYRYPEYDVYAEFVDGNYLYHTSASCEKAVLHTDINVTSDIFAYEMDEYYAIVNGGENPFSFSDFFAPVFVIDATIRAISSGNEEKIDRL